MDIRTGKGPEVNGNEGKETTSLSQRNWKHLGGGGSRSSSSLQRTPFYSRSRGMYVDLLEELAILSRLHLCPGERPKVRMRIRMGSRMQTRNAPFGVE